MTIANGVLPASWRSASLGEVLERIEAGTSFKAQDRPAVNGEVGVLKLSAVTWSTFQPSENKALFPGCDPTGCPRVQNGDLLISRANTTELIGAVVMVPEDHPNLILSDKTLRLVPKANVAYSNYLLHALRTPEVRKHLERHATGTSGSMRNISQANIRTTRIPLPPFSEQRRIAAILDKADAIGRKREEGIRLTEELLRSTFLEMFGDPVTNPKGWEVVTLDDVIAEGPQNGLYRPSSDYGSGTLILRIDTFRGGEQLTAASINKRVRLDDSTQELYRLLQGDLLINRVNSRSYLGKAAVVTDLREPVVFESNMMRFSLKADRANPLFVLTMLGQPALNRQIQRAAKDAVNQSSINQTDVKNFVLPLPPLLLQRQYAALHERTLRLREKKTIAKLEHEALFATLIQRAFRGEV